MNFTYTGGTAKQKKWVDDALADCSFPVKDRLASVSVTVKWADQLPASDTGKLHSYMVTSTLGGGKFLITIAAWADDPLNPENLGLPNPAQDIYDFYKESFVHEIGHVVAFSTFAQTIPSAPVAQACALFWTENTSDGSARRYGAEADWDPAGVAWKQLITEAVAEVFRLTYYKGRQVFMNRTQWNIDPDAFQALLKLQAPAQTGILPVEYRSEDLDDISDYLIPTEVNGLGPDLSKVYTIAGGAITLTGNSAADTMNPLIYGAKMPLFEGSGFPWESIIKVRVLGEVLVGGIGPSSVFVPPGMGVGDLDPDHLNAPPSLFAGWFAGFIGDQFPYWVRLLTNDHHNFFYMVYDADPEVVGGPPVSVQTFSVGYVRGQPVPVLQLAPGTVIDYWHIKTYVEVLDTPSPGDYPFGGGDFEVGDGALRGAVLLGH